MKKLSTLFCALCAYIGAYSMNYVQVNNSNPGDLLHNISNIMHPDIITQLKVTGNIDARDIHGLINCSALVVLDLSEATITAYSGTEGTLYGTQTDYYDNILPINSFKDNSTLEVVKIPNTCEIIDEGAFVKCTSLKEFIAPLTTKEIAPNAFRDCVSLIKAIFPFVQRVCNNAFTGCKSLTYIYFGERITNFESDVFNGCSRLNVIGLQNKIPPTYINPLGCASTTTMEVPEDFINNYSSTQWKSFLLDKSHTCIARFESGYNPIDIINKLAYSNLNLINNLYFYGITDDYQPLRSGLTSLKTLDLTYCEANTIPSGAFGGCASLTSLAVPNNLQEIGDYAFDGTQISTIKNLPPIHPPVLYQNSFDMSIAANCLLEYVDPSIYLPVSLWDQFYMPTKVNTIHPSTPFKYANGQLSIDGLNPGETITIFSAAGAKISSFRYTGACTLNLKKGIYVIKAGDKNIQKIAM